MKRGDIVIVAMAGDYGKPRPAVVVQSDLLNHLGSILVCPITSDIQPLAFYRLDIMPSAMNGLRKPSQIMIDKLSAVQRQKTGSAIGTIDAGLLEEFNGLLAAMIGLLD